MNMASPVSIEIQVVIPKAQGVVGLMVSMFIFGGSTSMFN